MSDWDGPTPSDSGISRRSLLAALGGATVLGGGAVAFGSDISDAVTGGTAEQLATVSGRGSDVAEEIIMDEGVPLRATASINSPAGETGEVYVEVIDIPKDKIIIGAFGTGDVTARATTESSGWHYFSASAPGRVEATLYRRSTGLF